jgi:hypothetical protein
MRTIHIACLMFIMSFISASVALAANSPPAIATLSPLPANECDISSNAPANMCGMVTSVIANGAVVTDNVNAPMIGARSMANSIAVTAIDTYGYCRYVNNNSAESIFVPFQTPREWLAFINAFLPVNTAPDADIILLDCSRGGGMPIPPNFGNPQTDPQTNQCVSNPPSQNIIAPYMPYPPAASYTSVTPLTFNCLSPDGTPFTETAVAQLTGIDSGFGPNAGVVGWTTSNVLYTYNGICGAANGIAAVAAPTGNLCHVGVASTPAQTTDNNGGTIWTWTCSGGNGGGNAASCATSDAPVVVSLAPQQCTGSSTQPVDLSILVDASASMQPALAAEDTAFANVLTNISANSNINYSIVMIGGTGGYAPSGNVANNYNKNCPYGYLAPFGRPNVPIMLSNLSQAQANTATPIAAAMNLAANDLTNTAHQRAMILISDGVETCVAGDTNDNVIPTIQQIQANGIAMYGVQIEDGSNDAGSAGNFNAFNGGFTTVNGGNNNSDIDVSQLTAALNNMLNTAITTTCQLSATIADPASGTTLGTLTSGGSMSLMPGIYNVTYSLCGQTFTQSVPITVATQLNPGLACP